MSGRQAVQVLALAVVLVAAVAFPFWANRTQPYYLQIAINIISFAILALSWDMLARTGQHIEIPV